MPGLPTVLGPVVTLDDSDRKTRQELVEPPAARTVERRKVASVRPQDRLSAEYEKADRSAGESQSAPLRLLRAMRANLNVIYHLSGRIELTMNYPETSTIFAYWMVSPVRTSPMAPGTRFLNWTCGSKVVGIPFRPLANKVRVAVVFSRRNSRAM